jgi:ADP-ribose pyrophosphatase YjhB (NUDIX family)
MELNESLAVRVNAIAAVARTGLAWTKELYERERYERILELTAEMAELLASETIDPATSAALAAELKQGWLAQVTPGAAGYVTPKVSTGAACFDQEGRILLGKRGDSGLWFFPTGWQEVGLTPAENVVKEVREETGIICRPLRLIAVRDTRFYRASASGPTIPNPNQSTIHNIALTFLCEALTAEFKLHPLETREAGFFKEEEALRLVPERVAAVIQQGFAAWRGELAEPYFDI